MRIQDHKLAWRWTDPAYAVLPNKVLAQMHSVTSDEAKALYKRAQGFMGNHGLSTELRPEMVSAEGGRIGGRFQLAEATSATFRAASIAFLGFRDRAAYNLGSVHFILAGVLLSGFRRSGRVSRVRGVDALVPS